MKEKKTYIVISLILIMVAIIVLQYEIFAPATVAVVFLVPAAFFLLPFVIKRKK